jgi:hypothetical protein
MADAQSPCLAVSPEDRWILWVQAMAMVALALPPAHLVQNCNALHWQAALLLEQVAPVAAEPVVQTGNQMTEVQRSLRTGVLNQHASPA